jgi:hypothetical protein
MGTPPSINHRKDVILSGLLNKAAPPPPAEPEYSFHL